MSFAVGLGLGRPRPSAVIGLSGFVPTVEGWELGPAPFPPIAVAHGTYDPVIPVELAHRTVAQLEAAGAEVLYRESPIDHAIDPAFVEQLRPWIYSGRRSAQRVADLAQLREPTLEVGLRVQVAAVHRDRESFVAFELRPLEQRVEQLLADALPRFVGTTTSVISGVSSSTNP